MVAPTLALAPAPTPVPTLAPAPFSVDRIKVGPEGCFRPWLLGRGAPLPQGQAALALVTEAQRAVIGRLAELMPFGPAGYQEVLVTPRHLAFRRQPTVDGCAVVDLLRFEDAAAQLATGRSLALAKTCVGHAGAGREVRAEVGPVDTLRLYRQLPARAEGDVASTDGFTSFALSLADAFHPFGAAGPTVAFCVPRPLFDRAVRGEAGGTGWTGGGLGIDVEEEVQLDTHALRPLLP
ncbi:MAG: hypothetical protein IT371_00720 [Deltaproteobacteria bacterium]|nr:hypothetical protein [Deltaproteobacteria bacterium]